MISSNSLNQLNDQLTFIDAQRDKAVKLIQDHYRSLVNNVGEHIPFLQFFENNEFITKWTFNSPEGREFVILGHELSEVFKQEATVASILKQNYLWMVEGEHDFIEQLQSQLMALPDELTRAITDANTMIEVMERRHIETEISVAVARDPGRKVANSM